VAFRTAPRSCASYPAEAVALSPALLTLIGQLDNRKTRSAVAHELARQLGADDLLLFIRDPALGVLLPALGFPQTLPTGREWPEFLRRCEERGHWEGDLPSLGEGRVPVAAWGCRGGKALVVLLGGQPRPGELASFCLLLPALSGTFEGEIGEVIAAGQAATAREVAERAEALAQALESTRRNLEEALRTSREADRRKDEFLAMLGHELRNPLAPVLNALQVMRMVPPEQPTFGRAQEVIERQIHSLARLVDDLLDVSRISRGKIELRKAQVDLVEVARQAVETSRPLMEARRHELSITVPQDHLWLHADITRLEQVLANLLNNAAKYTPPGGRIWLTAEREGDQAVLRVRDTGLGIARELQPRIFDIFVQEERSLERAQGGLGLGLALVKNLTQLHDGTVEVRSDGPGSGSEFILRLPLRADLPENGAAPSAAAIEFSSRQLRVLVVDDNRDAAETLGELLSLWGHQVSLAFDGNTALDQAQTMALNVVLLDIGLPGIDGYEVARRLRSCGRSDLGLVALTGYGLEADRRRALEEGFDLHLTKPVDPAELEAALLTLSGH